LSVVLKRLKKTIFSCKSNYWNYPNVCGISVGFKYKNGEKIKGSKAVQFFVTKKVDKDTLNKVLPKYVYERYVSGRINRNKKLATDVIQLDNLKLCCGGGDKIAYVGGNGTATLLFQNKDPHDNGFYMFTCSHVVGDMNSSPGTDQEITGGNQNCFFSAQVWGNSILENGYVDFDIALCTILGADDTFQELKVADSGLVLDGFLIADQIGQGDVLSCSFPESGTTSIVASSWQTSLTDIDNGYGQLIEVGNLIACEGHVIQGDSGGLVYSGSKAVGILVAKTDNDWAFIHPLNEAINYFNNIFQQNFKIFNT
jgi:hypothetical protein